ncbi:MAG TPA: preprotein translocase subunit SecE [Candidatus Absconditabacterales bacterium]|nr:preprotein translocase subunit SecE [Candidatus Absconditabacterales bacterium]HOQ79011.1 preprotein translocase subunit SecE [Candidatus Absconditabacterales bacterium]HPK28098.1 preprotein translocase subunit SecE [Candidatus Absconditabacterales bacterium]
MMKFIYDSLDTIKGLKHPNKKMYINLTISIFAMVIVAGLYFIFADTIFSSIYNLFYSMAS